MAFQITVPDLVVSFALGFGAALTLISYLITRKGH